MKLLYAQTERGYTMFNLFNKDKDAESIKDRNKELETECDTLRGDRRELKDEVEQLKLKKKIEEEDIKHMVKMKEERLDLEHQKHLQKSEMDKQKEIGEIKDKYRDKTEAQLEKQLTSMKEMYGEILERLPNINAKLKL